MDWVRVTCRVKETRFDLLWSEVSGGLPFSLPVKHAQHVVRRSLTVCHFLHLVNREVRCSVINYPDH